MTHRPPHSARLTEDEQSIVREPATVQRCAEDYDTDEARAMREAFDARCRKQADQ